MNRNRIWLGLMIAVTGCPWCVAQKPGADTPTGIFPSAAEYSQFMGRAKAVAYGPEGSPELQAMIPLLNDIALNQPIGSTANRYNATGTTLELLSSPEVRKELEMVDSQHLELQQMNADIQKRMADQLRQLDFSDSANLARQIRLIRDRSQNDLDALLLPHQLSRLNQIRMQSLLRRHSLVEILTSDPIRSQLEITDDQLPELRQAEREIEEDLAKQIAKLREQARERLLSKLKPAQKSKAQQLIGEAFEIAADGEPKTGPSQGQRKAKR